MNLDAVIDGEGTLLDALLGGRLLLVGSLSSGGQEGQIFTGTRALLPH